MSLPRIPTPAGFENPQDVIIDMVVNQLHQQIKDYDPHDLIRAAVIMGMQISVGMNPEEFEEV